MDLTTTLFDIKVFRKPMTFVEFTESEIEIIMLSPVDGEINSGHRYMFGTFYDNKFYWFFNGKSIANSRQMMKDVYAEISNQFKGKNHKIFTFKGNLYGSRI